MKVTEHPKVQEAIRRCARMEAWLKCATSENQKELARQQLVDAKEQLQAAIREVATQRATVSRGPEHIREINIERK